MKENDMVCARVMEAISGDGSHELAYGTGISSVNNYIRSECTPNSTGIKQNDVEHNTPVSRLPLLQNAVADLMQNDVILVVLCFKAHVCEGVAMLPKDGHPREEDHVCHLLRSPLQLWSDPGHYSEAREGLQTSRSDPGHSRRVGDE